MSTLPPEAALLNDALERMVPRPSIRELAGRVQLSEGRVRQILKGYQSLGRGRTNPVVAPPATLARLALAVGIEAEDLKAVGREDAAEHLQLFQGAPRPLSLGTVNDMVALDELSAWLRTADWGADPPGRALWLFKDEQLVEEVRRRLAERGERLSRLAWADSLRDMREAPDESLSSASSDEAEMEGVPDVTQAQVALAARTHHNQGRALRDHLDRLADQADQVDPPAPEPDSQDVGE